MCSRTSPVGGKICRNGQLLPGSPDRTRGGKPGFIGFFCIGTALAENTHRTICRPPIGAATLEFCHVICSGRCVIGHRCPQGADIVEIVCADHRRRPERHRACSALPSSNPSASIGSGNGSGGSGSHDIAGNHERAA